MTTLNHDIAELIVDVLTVSHFGAAGYEVYATEEVREAVRQINNRTRELRDLKISGTRSFRQAKVEWVEQVSSAEA